jgi:hypothetical protein
MTEIDWTVLDEYPENTCYCWCETVFRSHAKFVLKPEPGMRTRKPCPKCARDDNCRRISSDPETWTVGDS